MSNGFLSQEEIDSLLNGGNGNEPELKVEELTDTEKDLLGEVGNIAMGSASTALYQIINKKVNITTPKVTVTSLDEIKEGFSIPNIILDVKYVSGIVGRNILIMKVTDAAVIASLMMGGNGITETTELTEIEISAVQEAMNQMIGSAATSMATMFAREVNISPPNSKIWRSMDESVSEAISGSEKIVKVSFKLEIEGLLESEIMQILPIETAKTIVNIMMGEDSEEQEYDSSLVIEDTINVDENSEMGSFSDAFTFDEDTSYKHKESGVENKPQVEVHKANLKPLQENKSSETYNNIDLILDVPLEVSVVLGRTKKSIRDILDLSSGSLIELETLAEEPVEVLINGKKIAYGEVVVVDENFGVKITNIVSGAERIKSLR